MVQLIPNKYMKSDFEMRDFQQEGVWFLLQKKKGILAFSTGLGKTNTILSTFSYIKAKNPKAFLLYITEKTLIEQAAIDCDTYFKFKYKCIYDMPAKQRTAHFLKSYKSDILFTNYAQLIWSEQELIDLYEAIDDENIVLAFDEATRIKGATSQTAMIAKGMCKRTPFVIASTATPSKGKLEDFFNLSKTIGYKLMIDQEFVDRFVVYEKTYGMRLKVKGNFLS